MRLRLPILAVALLLAACGDTEGGGPPTTVGCKDAAGGRVTLVAQPGTRWDTDCLRATAGPLTIVVDNQDDGGSHNVHLPSAPDSPATELEQGPRTDELDVSLDPGSYEFVCDLHSNMVGTLTVAAANPP
jgi:plastocyanin